MGKEVLKERLRVFDWIAMKLGTIIGHIGINILGGVHLEDHGERKSVKNRLF